LALRSAIIPGNARFDQEKLLVNFDIRLLRWLIVEACPSDQLDAGDADSDAGRPRRAEGGTLIFKKPPRRCRQPYRHGPHRRLGLMALGELYQVPIPDGYRRSIRAWAARCGIR
jgi:hypothetical protein